MTATALLAAAILAQSAFSLALEPAAPEQTDVGFEALARGAPEEAIARIEANSALASDDPAALINLGNAYAQLGETDKALRHYRAAVDSRTRYDLELADGRWMDSRRAAREALNDLNRAVTRQAIRR